MPDRCAHCGDPLTASPSDWWCTESCQIAWQGTEHPRAIPHPLGGVTYPVDPGDPLGERLQSIYALRQWIADTDPDPADLPGDRLHYGRHLA